VSQGASTVLLATDLSEPALKAAEVAVAEAQRRGARLHVLHVVRSPAQVARVSAPGELAARLGMEVPAVAATRVGSPAAEIVRYAEEHDVELIVVGGHGRTGFTQTLLGSVAERVARTSRRPVLVVPCDGRAAARQPALPLERCVVCGAPTEDFVCEPCRANIRASGRAAQWIAPQGGYTGELDREQCEEMLRLKLIGHLGCCAGGVPYVVPMAFAYEDSAVYLRSGDGMKVHMMRESPSVCLQVDHIEDLANWRSVIVWGTFHELHGPEATRGVQAIMRRMLAWASDAEERPAASIVEVNGEVGHRAVNLGRDAIIWRIDVTEMTGRYQQR
jgi:nitroimidazol reductase NimA-like FMN-containing flavoprotein (pyridoxamine 5'-phosphate oxidase superfamily)/nucleotide-binding universal stress UspA family protein